MGEIDLSQSTGEVYLVHPYREVNMISPDGTYVSPPSQRDDLQNSDSRRATGTLEHHRARSFPYSLPGEAFAPYSPLPLSDIGTSHHLAHPEPGYNFGSSRTRGIGEGTRPNREHVEQSGQARPTSRRFQPTARRRSQPLRIQVLDLQTRLSATERMQIPSQMERLYASPDDPLFNTHEVVDQFSARHARERQENQNIRRDVPRASSLASNSEVASRRLGQGALSNARHSPYPPTSPSRQAGLGQKFRSSKSNTSTHNQNIADFTCDTQIQNVTHQGTSPQQYFDDDTSLSYPTSNVASGSNHKTNRQIISQSHSHPGFNPNDSDTSDQYSVGDSSNPARSLSDITPDNATEPTTLRSGAAERNVVRSRSPVMWSLFTLAEMQNGGATASSNDRAQEAPANGLPGISGVNIDNGSSPLCGPALEIPQVSQPVHSHTEVSSEDNISQLDELSLSYPPEPSDHLEGFNITNDPVLLDIADSLASWEFANPNARFYHAYESPSASPTSPGNATQPQ
ncbi:hypothetical protein SCHPADRAFT_1001334 [Schizopora paradoxa]|uniref:Uncharacterized protein n=1 Tax=Schizopora paradoxa TaxID=27342 RepID=A0A0H2R7R0_9AGAM|nr:hypothetical protein SCHPADRAFT_1001334 [Schizopora paradoxa]